MYRRAARDVRACAFPTACATTRSCPQPSSRPPARPATAATTSRCRGRDHRARPADRGAMGRGLALCAGAVRPRAGDGGRARPDPGRHQIRVRRRRRTGRIVLADEIHTPDSSRYWFADSYPERFAAGEPPESFDKDFVRAWVAARCDPYKDPIPEIPREMILQDRARSISRRSRRSRASGSRPRRGTCWNASAPTWRR